MRTFGQFELIGFHLDHFVDGKYVGSIKFEETEETQFGYHSRKYQVAEEDLIIPKGKNESKIKKGTKYYTELQALCGKRVEC